MIHRAELPMPFNHIVRRQMEVVVHHRQAAVAQDSLKREDVPAVFQLVDREGMPARVHSIHPRRLPQPREQQVKCIPIHRPAQPVETGAKTLNRRAVTGRH